MTSEPTDRNSLNEDERMEYNQIGDFYKHDDAMAYRLASILLPLSFGAVTAASKYPDMKITLCFFSIGIYLWWALSTERLAWFSKIRMSRAHELEEKAGLWHHRRIDKPPNDFKCELGNFLSVRKIRWGFFIFLIIFWVILF